MTWQPSLEDFLQVVATVLVLDIRRTRAVVDAALAESALGAPFAGLGDQERYPTIEEKVAVLVERLARNHPVRIDGNKRSAFAMGVLFAERNGCSWRPEDSDRDAAMVESLAAGHASHDEAVAWVRERTR
jgi:prophage maintenance system killer protein